MPKFIYGETTIDLPDDPKAAAQLVKDLDIEAYHDLGSIAKHGDNAILSKSQLAELDCPQKFKHRYIDEQPAEEKDHLNVGNTVHTLALEPDLFHDRFYVLPEGLRRDPRTAAYKAEIEAAGARKMVTFKDFENVKGMAKALTESKIAMTLLEGTGVIEGSIFWTDEQSGVKLRCRPDLMRDDGLIVDLKTGHTAEPMKFSKIAFDMSYDISVAMTCEGYKQLTGKKPDNYVFLMIEADAPHVIEAYDSFRPWDPDDLTKFTYFDAGWFRFRRMIDRYVECRDTGIWPGYSKIIKPMSVPGYALKQLEKGQ